MDEILLPKSLTYFRKHGRPRKSNALIAEKYLHIRLKKEALTGFVENPISINYEISTPTKSRSTLITDYFTNCSSPKTVKRQYRSPKTPDTMNSKLTNKKAKKTKSPKKISNTSKKRTSSRLRLSSTDSTNKSKPRNYSKSKSNMLESSSDDDSIAPSMANKRHSRNSRKVKASTNTVSFNELSSSLTSKSFRKRLRCYSSSSQSDSIKKLTKSNNKPVKTLENDSFRRRLRSFDSESDATNGLPWSPNKSAVASEIISPRKKLRSQADECINTNSAVLNNGSQSASSAIYNLKTSQIRSSIPNSIAEMPSPILPIKKTVSKDRTVKIKETQKVVESKTSIHNESKNDDADSVSQFIVSTSQLISRSRSRSSMSNNTNTVDVEIILPKKSTTIKNRVVKTKESDKVAKNQIPSISNSEVSNNQNLTRNRSRSSIHNSIDIMDKAEMPSPVLHTNKKVISAEKKQDVENVVGTKTPHHNGSTNDESSTVDSDIQFGVSKSQRLSRSRSRSSFSNSAKIIDIDEMPSPVLPINKRVSVVKRKGNETIIGCKTTQNNGSTNDESSTVDRDTQFGMSKSPRPSRNLSRSSISNNSKIIDIDEKPSPMHPINKKIASGVKRKEKETIIESKTTQNNSFTNVESTVDSDTQFEMSKSPRLLRNRSSISTSTKIIDVDEIPSPIISTKKKTVSIDRIVKTKELETVSPRNNESIYNNLSSNISRSQSLNSTKTVNVEEKQPLVLKDNKKVIANNIARNNDNSEVSTNEIIPRTRSRSSISNSKNIASEMASPILCLDKLTFPKNRVVKAKNNEKVVKKKTEQNNESINDDPSVVDSESQFGVTRGQHFPRTRSRSSMSNSIMAIDVEDVISKKRTSSNNRALKPKENEAENNIPLNIAPAHDISELSNSPMVSRTRLRSSISNSIQSGAIDAISSPILRLDRLDVSKGCAAKTPGKEKSTKNKDVHKTKTSTKKSEVNKSVNKSKSGSLINSAQKRITESSSSNMSEVVVPHTHRRTSYSRTAKKKAKPLSSDSDISNDRSHSPSFSNEVEMEDVTTMKSCVIQLSKDDIPQDRQAENHINVSIKTNITNNSEFSNTQQKLSMSVQRNIGTQGLLKRRILNTDIDDEGDEEVEASQIVTETVVSMNPGTSMIKTVCNEEGGGSQMECVDARTAQPAKKHSEQSETILKIASPNRQLGTREQPISSPVVVQSKIREAPSTTATFSTEPNSHSTPKTKNHSSDMTLEPVLVLVRHNKKTKDSKQTPRVVKEPAATRKTKTKKVDINQEKFNRLQQIVSNKRRELLDSQSKDKKVVASEVVRPSPPEVVVKPTWWGVDNSIEKTSEADLNLDKIDDISLGFSGSPKKKQQPSCCVENRMDKIKKVIDRGLSQSDIDVSTVKDDFPELLQPFRPLKNCKSLNSPVPK